MRLHSISATPGSRRTSKRVGRGPGSGRGTYSGRGVKGQKARSGHHGGPRPGFEGGQTPLLLRMPKLGGFKNPNHVEYQVVNLEDLVSFKAGSTVTKEDLKSHSLIHSISKPVKLLGRGELKHGVTLVVDAASASAKAALEKAGGSVTLPTPPPARAQKPAKADAQKA